MSSIFPSSSPLSVPPQFGDVVRLTMGGPMLVVVDAIELAAEAPPTSLTTVFYLDDCGTIRSERIPWGILSTCSVELLAEESRIRCEEMDEEYSARENLRTNARLKALHEALSDSSDPMSFFGALRQAVLDLLHSGFEVDHRGSPEDIAAREEPTPETARCSVESPAEETEVKHPDPLEGTFGSSMSCLSQSELESAQADYDRKYGDAPAPSVDDDATNHGPAFVPHTHF
jgi:hypothetical protein